MKKVFICLILLLSFSLVGCSNSEECDNIEPKTTEPLEDKSFDLPAELLKKLRSIFPVKNLNEPPATMSTDNIKLFGDISSTKMSDIELLDVVLQDTFEDYIDSIIKGKKLIQVSFSSDECYYACLYKAEPDQFGVIDYIWRGFEKAEDITYVYADKQLSKSLQINKATDIIDLLANEKKEYLKSQFEYYVEYRVGFNNNINTSKKLELNKTIISCCNINSYHLFTDGTSMFPKLVSDSTIYHKIYLASSKDSSIDYDYVLSNLHYEFGKYYDDLISVFKHNFIMEETYGYKKYYGLLSLEELKKIINKFSQE